MKKRRADERLFEELNLESLALARALIMEGRAFAGERKLKSPGELVSEKETMRVRGALDPYVSRGAHKLKKALEVFALDVRGADVRGRGRFHRRLYRRAFARGREACLRCGRGL